MVSLLQRLHRADAANRPAVAAAPGAGAWLPAAAALAVTLVGLAGLGVALVVVQTLDPGGGLPVSGSLALAGRLWLLAQGAELRLSSGPLVLAPLLLTLGIAWGLNRAGRGVVRLRDLRGARAGALTAAVIVAVHTALGLLLAFLLDGPGAGVGYLRTAAGLLVLSVLAAGWGVAREAGLLDPGGSALPSVAGPVARGVLAGLLTALAACTAVVGIALASDTEGYARLSRSLGGAAAGAVGLLALGVVLLPNAAAAVLGLAAGPGFAVGTGTLVSVHGVTLGAVPALPLLAALPDTQAVPLVALVSQVIPACAGLVTGLTVGRRMTDDDGGSVVAGLYGVLAGALLGVASAALVWAGGGTLGDGALAQVGAPPLTTGLAVAAQAGIAAALAAAISRWRSHG